MKTSLFERDVRSGMKDWRYRIGWIAASVELWFHRLRMRTFRFMLRYCFGFDERRAQWIGEWHRMTTAAKGNSRTRGTGYNHDDAIDELLAMVRV